MFLKRDMIVVDLALRGFTLDSYIGETVALESLRDTRGNYSIDATIIYLAGFCNEVYAVWALAQAYPQLFAGVVSVLEDMDKRLI